MISAMTTMNPVSYSSFVQNGNKIYVPVESNQVVYSQFDHVSGYAQPSHSLENPVPVSKIKILNTLIEQLVNLQTDKAKPKLPTDLTDKQVDSLIKDYENKIQVAMNFAKANPFGFSGASGIAKGLVISTTI